MASTVLQMAIRHGTFPFLENRAEKEGRTIVGVRLGVLAVPPATQLVVEDPVRQPSPHLTRLTRHIQGANFGQLCTS